MGSGNRHWTRTPGAPDSASALAAGLPQANYSTPLSLRFLIPQERKQKCLPPGVNHCRRAKVPTTQELWLRALFSFVFSCDLEIGLGDSGVGHIKSVPCGVSAAGVKDSFC